MEKKQDDGFAAINSKLDKAPKAGTLNYAQLSIVGGLITTLVGAVFVVCMIVAQNLRDRSDQADAESIRDRASIKENLIRINDAVLAEAARNTEIEKQLARTDERLKVFQELYLAGKLKE